MDVIITGVEETIKALELEITATIRKGRTAVALAGNQCKSDIQEIAPYHYGDYRRSIHAEPVDGPDMQPFVMVGTDKPQTAQLEYGGIIRAKNGEYLTFRTYDGEWHRVRSVYQPPHPHFRPVMDQNGPKYQEMIREYLADAGPEAMTAWQGSMDIFQSVQGSGIGGFGGIE